MKHVHSGQLERWLGTAGVEKLSASMRDFYHPIPVGGVPGNVMAMPGGDFTGEIRAGFEATGFDRAREIFARMRRGYRTACRPSGQLNTGFASLDALINAVTVLNQRQEIDFSKTGVTGVTSGCNDLFRAAGSPGAGGASSAAPGGLATTSSTTGAMPFTNAPANTTQHITTGYLIASVLNGLLLYDRIFSVVKTASSSATEAVTGVPTRYQSTTNTDPNYAGGNFCFPCVGSGGALCATAHNWTVCQYTNQAGSGASFPSATGNSSCIASRIDLPLGQWFLPLASGDNGVQTLTQMQNSAVVTGALDFVIGHPLVWMPCPIVNMACLLDGVNSAFNLVRVFDNACLTFLELPKSATTATLYTGSIFLAQN